MKQSNLPPGWNPDRVKSVLEHYELQTEEEAIIEDEKILESDCQTTLDVIKSHELTTI